MCEAREYRLLERLARDAYDAFKPRLPAGAQLWVQVAKERSPLPALGESARFGLGDWHPASAGSSHLRDTDPEILAIVRKETLRQEEGLELIASENYTSPAVMEAMGSPLTNKYSEGYVGKRYYGGNQVVDEMESLAIARARELFGAEHVNIQPLSGAPANLAVYLAAVKPGDKVLGLKLDHGGHLSHGHPVNFSGLNYDFSQYEVDEHTQRIDMNRVREVALRERPKMIIAGFSAYSRDIDWKAFKSIADEVGAVTFADIAHIAGLIAGKALENPVPIFDIVTTTTHKTLRGPRGAIIMCKSAFQKAIDRSVFPGVQGGPHDHINAAKAVCFKEALRPSFQQYAKDTIENARAMAGELMSRGYKLLTDGTDNHLMVVDLRRQEVSGKIAEVALERLGISCSRSTIPFDTRKAMDPSGIRLGTAALTTRGMGVREAVMVAGWIDEAISSPTDEDRLTRLRDQVKELCRRFPLYPAAPLG
jgi:glycine hydroxymethyltransferase